MFCGSSINYHTTYVQKALFLIIFFSYYVLFYMLVIHTSIKSSVSVFVATVHIPNTSHTIVHQKLEVVNYSSHDLFLFHRSSPKSSYTSTIFRLGAPTNGARKDIHFNDKSVIRGAFEGFSGGDSEKLNTWYKMLLYIYQYITPCIF